MTDPKIIDQKPNEIKMEIVGFQGITKEGDKIRLTLTNEKKQPVHLYFSLSLFTDLIQQIKNFGSLLGGLAGLLNKGKQ